MTKLSDLDETGLRALHGRVRDEYAAFQKRGLKLNMARGKPAPEQLDLCEALLRLPGEGEHTASDGTDARNYGGLTGLPETRRLFAQILDVDPERVVVAGNSSLSMMFDHVAFAMLHGVPDGAEPWVRQKVKFLCPAPGYDRHFAVCEEHGIELITVPMDGEGPVMDEVERLVKGDAAIKGIWCVPKYSNPTGVVYSDDVVRRLAAMETAAPDFRIFWDNAYVVHHLTEERVALLNIVTACAEAGNENRPLVFASTSKVTFAGAGMAALTSSKANVDWFLARASKRTIGPDKVNQLRHAALLPDLDALHRLMDEHRKILAPKFRAVVETFEKRLSDPRVAEWTEPKGGYFISLDVAAGCAKRTHELAKEAGIVMTPAGATFPYGKDPEDRNLRIAPSFPSVDEITQAAEGVALSVLLATTEKALAER